MIIASIILGLIVGKILSILYIQKIMLDLKSFVMNGELIIDKPHWYQLKNSYDRQELKDAISNAIDDLELPLVKYT